MARKRYPDQPWPRRGRHAGTLSQLNTEIDASLAARFREFVAGKGGRIRDHVEQALWDLMAKPEQPAPRRPVHTITSEDV